MGQALAVVLDPSPVLSSFSLAKSPAEQLPPPAPPHDALPHHRPKSNGPMNHRPDLPNHDLKQTLQPII